MTDCVVSLNNMAAAASLAGEQKQQAEQHILNGGSFYDYYQTQDQGYLAIGSLEPQFMQGVAQALALPILLEKGASLDPIDRQAVKQALQAKIATQPLAYWQACFAELDVCVEAVLALDEALDSRLAQERNWVTQVPFTLGSQQTEAQLALPIKFSRSQPVYKHVGQELGAGDWPS